MDKQVFIVEMFDFTPEEAMQLLNEKFADLPRDEQIIKTSLLKDTGIQKVEKYILGE